MSSDPLIIAAIGFGLGLAGSFLMSRGAFLLDMPNERSSHSTPTPRGGGAGIVLGFILISAAVIKDFSGAAVGAGVGLLGFFEDRLSLPAPLRLFLQLILALGAVLATRSTGPAILFWVILIAGTANFYNFLDGIDGIAGLTGAVSFSLLAFFSFYIAGMVEAGSVSIALAAGCLGFLPFNFPKARVFMGDAGSMFLGFEFALTVFNLSSSLRSLLCLGMFLCVFYADALLTLFFRWRRNEGLTVSHRGHLYQYLCNELSLPHWAVSASYAFIQLLFGVLSIFAYYRSIVWQLAVIAAFSTAFIIAYRSIKGLSPGQGLGQVANSITPP
ncbi:MAG: hypothetical protein Q7T24_01730 [Deltaproteobacteria bacterium]|nr:hypothetical protein [Deltaproteobacteria bacterium]